jgi:hypothetical protein
VFTINVDEVFCREGYIDAEGILAQLGQCGRDAGWPKMADLIRAGGTARHGGGAE